MEPNFLHENIFALHQLNLGQHTLYLMSDGGMHLLVNDEQIPYLVDKGISLDDNETYRLFISLQERFKKE